LEAGIIIRERRLLTRFKPNGLKEGLTFFNWGWNLNIRGPGWARNKGSDWGVRP